MTLQAFSFFHLNLAYSAIEEAQRQAVIDRCYWPLLRLARDRGLPLGIEASAWTLETIAAIDPAWLAELKRLVTQGTCEFIGCGYAQLIGPLVPAEVNQANLRIGMQRYEALLGMRPKLALVNEQAFAAGLVPLYQEAGYEALIMEWNNPARANPHWDPGWRYLPQYACGSGGTEMPLVWNKSVAFQKFQRYVHGEMELDEYLAYVDSHLTDTVRAFPIYGNDVEVFDFRPGRYMTEAALHGEGEWQRIDALYGALQAHPGIDMVSPSEVLRLLDQPGAGHRLQLATAAHPVPVKKQNKYNLLRWAVTGRDDLGINTQCWRIFEAMQRSMRATDADWTELCYLWSSDFRTHITEARWTDYRARLARIAKQWPIEPPASAPVPAPEAQSPAALGPSAPAMTTVRRGRFLDVVGQRFELRFNCLRGLALDRMVDHTVSEKSLCGTLHHGYFDDIQWAADYYSGHLVFESPGQPKVTDLNPVEPELLGLDGGVLIKGSIKTPLGSVEKCWHVDEFRGTITLSYRLHWNDVPPGSLRLGYLTLHPEAFEPHLMTYSTHNGGWDIEEFSLDQTDFDHGAPVSLLTSANQAVGMTRGQLTIGEENHALRIQMVKSNCAAVGLMSNRLIRNSYLCRFAFSLKEIDDTSCNTSTGAITFKCMFEANRTRP